ncbi:hypothetical protein EW026_g3083 [Hermanssonia centrifuga]|uniref:Uncharacterized protein n=1 Tax=Hermanssonia centrifuga TaxID=98765 RepID=A0A4S4KLA4_9APHY|nr:hypothetical protein EW026_g3083 [Hermanssonia centrifuga]
MYHDDTDGKGVFRSEVLMRTFAAYLTQCDPTAGSLVDFGVPIGGLAMCAAAVERGFLLYQTGEIQSNKEQKAEIQAALDKGNTQLAKDLKAFHIRLKTFSEPGWSKATQEYSKVIDKLSERVWGGIIRAGMKHVKNSKTLKKRAEGDDEEEEDNQAMMIVDSGYSSGSDS